mmetsp:Transcript_20381/g.31162  ORF Transcript_20381/g.31162 Transcript_20381/m.31162 type:complete len:105 (-) Transcript_20381:287-601(-)
MRSKGLAGIFDHDFVLNPSSFDNVEEEAAKVAKEAAAALADSVSSQRKRNRMFTPTWTRSAETSAGRFGGAGTHQYDESLDNRSGVDAGFGGASLSLEACRPVP